jgi:hypothetical protein
MAYRSVSASESAEGSGRVHSCECADLFFSHASVRPSIHSFRLPDKTPAPTGAEADRRALNRTRHSYPPSLKCVLACVASACLCACVGCSVCGWLSVLSARSLALGFFLFARRPMHRPTPHSHTELDTCCSIVLCCCGPVWCVRACERSTCLRRSVWLFWPLSPLTAAALQTHTGTGEEREKTNERAGGRETDRRVTSMGSGGVRLALAFRRGRGVACLPVPSRSRQAAAPGRWGGRTTREAKEARATFLVLWHSRALRVRLWADPVCVVLLFLFALPPCSCCH